MDLDDEELKATKNKFYKIDNDKFNKKYHFILESKIEKIDKILYDSYERDCGIGKENYYYIMRFITQQQKELEELKKENNEMWSHIPRLD